MAGISQYKPPPAFKRNVSPATPTSTAVIVLGRSTVPDRIDHLLGGFELRQVAGVVQELEAGEWDGGGVGAAVVGVDDLVAVPPQHQGGQLNVGALGGQGAPGADSRAAQTRAR